MASWRSDAGGTLDGEVRGHGKTAKPEAKAKPIAEAPLLDQQAANTDSESKPN